MVFDSGEYAPHTATGQRLLAHELTHTMQQQAAGPMVQLASNETLLDGLPDDSLDERAWSPMPHEATVIGAAGEKLDVKELKSRLLEQGYDEVYAKDEFGQTPQSKWLEEAFPDGRKRPDVVAINHKTGEILVVDVTASPSSMAKSRYGDLKQLPIEWETRERPRFHGNAYRSADLADEMKPPAFYERPMQADESRLKLHIEKTIEDARQLSRSLKGELEQYRVMAMDVHWRTGTQTKKILVKPGGRAAPTSTPGGTTPAPSKGEATKPSAPVATEAVTSPTRAPQVTLPPAPSSQAPAPTAPPIAVPESAPTTPAPASPTQEKAPTPVTPLPSSVETNAAKLPTKPEPPSPALRRPPSAEPEMRHARPAPPSPREALLPPAPTSNVTSNLPAHATRGKSPTPAPRQFNLALEGSHAVQRPPRVVSETELPRPRGVGLRGGPSPLLAPAVGLAANVAGALLTSWLHDSILESVNNMPQPIIEQVELWKERGMEGRNALDLLASNIGETRSQFQENRGHLSLALLYFWTQLDQQETAERYAALDSLEDSIMQDTAQLLTGQSNIEMALELEPRIQQSVEAAAELHSYIKSPLGTTALFYGLGMSIEEMTRITDNLAWYQSAHRQMLRSLHELSTDVQHHIAVDDELQRQIEAARRNGGRAPR